MPASTNPDGLPYPVDADPPDIPGDMQALASAVQSALLARDASIGQVDTKIDEKVLYGPVANLPATLAAGQLYAGY